MRNFNEESHILITMFIDSKIRGIITVLILIYCISSLDINTGSYTC